MNSPHHISVCIATYRRPERLAVLLQDLAAQSVLPHEVVVVDNDVEGSARAVVEARRAAGVPFVLLYDIQPKRNIALTRNRTVALATGQWLAFIDDDERAPVAWLQQLIEAAERFGADGLLGPVVPVIPADAPDWIRRGRLYDFPRMPSGAEVPLNRLRFGNALLRAEVLRGEPGPFDVNYGLTTGEDGDMLARLVRKGARILWCDEAGVEEPVEAARLSLRWLLLRAVSGGQEFARKSLKGTYGQMSLADRAQLFVRAALQLCIASVLALLCLPAGRHHSAHWLTRAAANVGKLSILWGWHYREYA